MADYQIVYLDSDGDDYTIDGCENPYLKVGIVNPELPNVIFPITIYWATDESPQIAVHSHSALSLDQIGATLKKLEDAINDPENYAEFYSDIFYDEETEKHSKTLTFSL
jgi:hypothetical protein